MKSQFYTRFRPAPKVDFIQEDTKSLTVQSEEEACNVNKIMEKFERTGQITHVVNTQPYYQDNTQILSYENALQLMTTAQDDFMALPSEVRTYFGHDPKNFVKTILDPSEGDLLNFKKMNLIVERQKTPEDVLHEIAENTKKAAGTVTPT